MRINTFNLRDEVSEYVNLIEDYEETVLNIYNVFSNISNIWKSEKASIFFDDIYIEKKNLYETINELKDIKKVYKYLISKYEKFGDELEISLNNRDEILNSYNDYLSVLEKILNKFRNLSLNNDISERERILTQKNRLINLIEKVKALKSKVVKDFNKIEEIEKEVKNKINNLEINKIQEKDIYRYSLGSKSSNISFDIEKLQTQINKMDIYIEEESIFFSDFSSKLNSINSYYTSNNKNLIDNKKVELKKVFNVIINEHRKDINLLNSEVTFFKSLPSYLSDNLNNISGDQK